MVTSCYRRMHNYQKALELYEQIHTEHPDNLECLRYLVAICKGSLAATRAELRMNMLRLNVLPFFCAPFKTLGGPTTSISSASRASTARRLRRLRWAAGAP